MTHGLDDLVLVLLGEELCETGAQLLELLREEGEGERVNLLSLFPLVWCCGETTQRTSPEHRTKGGDATREDENRPFCDDL